jgi:hypothetical protein
MRIQTIKSLVRKVRIPLLRELRDSEAVKQTESFMKDALKDLTLEQALYLMVTIYMIYWVVTNWMYTEAVATLFFIDPFIILNLWLEGVL